MEHVETAVDWWEGKATVWATWWAARPLPKEANCHLRYLKKMSLMMNIYPYGAFLVA